jgi:hypothetical protein
MEPITFELLDGFFDPATKQTHKAVVMHRMTMAEQIKIKSDATIQALARSQYSLGAPGHAAQLLALTELQQFYLVVFKQTVDSIGTFTQEQIRGLAILENLTTRDINWMIANQNDPQNKMIPLKAVNTALDNINLDPGARAAFVEALESLLGEAIAAT